MSGRFTNAYLTRWATGNYPAGANDWSGFPKQVVPGYDGFTPDAVVTSTVMNWVIDSSRVETNARLQDVYDYVTNPQVTQWHNVKLDVDFAGYSAPLVYRAKWWYGGNGTGNNLTKRYPSGMLFAATANSAGSTVGLSCSGNGGRTWKILGVPTSSWVNKCFAVSYAGKVLFDASPTSTTKSMLDMATGTLSSFNWPVSQMNIVSMENVKFSGIDVYILSLGSTVAGAKVVLWDGNIVTTDLSSQIPAAMSSDASFVQASHDTSSAGLTLVFSTVSGRNTYMGVTYSGAGGATSTITGYTSPVPAGYSAKSVTCSNGVWYLLANNGTDSKVWTSSTGTGSWTLQSTLTGHVLNDMVASGAMLLAAELGAVASPYGGTPNQLWFSIDAGVTFTRAPDGVLDDESSSITPIRLAVAQGANGSSRFLAYNSVQLLIGVGHWGKAV